MSGLSTTCTTQFIKCFIKFTTIPFPLNLITFVSFNCEIGLHKFLDFGEICFRSTNPRFLSVFRTPLVGFGKFPTQNGNAAMSGLSTTCTTQFIKCFIKFTTIPFPLNLITFVSFNCEIGLHKFLDFGEICFRSTNPRFLSVFHNRGKSLALQQNVTV